MKNPWKRHSKINPQKEFGHRQICNDVYHALLAGNFTGAEYKIILAIIDKTWGFKKQADAISISKLCAMTNLTKRTVQRTIISLKTKRVVYMSPSTIRVSSGSPLNNYSLNKHYDTWKVEGCQIVQGCHIDHPPKADKGDIQVLGRVTSRPPTKETTKETSTKEKYSIARKNNFDQFWNIYPKKKSKGQARKTWDSLLKQKKLPELSILLNAIAAQKAGHDWQKDGGKYIPYPSTWLNSEGWEDEIISHNSNQDQIRPKSVRDVKDIDQIRMAKYLNEKRRKRNEESNINDSARSVDGDERQLPESTPL